MIQKKCKYKSFQWKEWIKPINSFFKISYDDILHYCYPCFCWNCNIALVNHSILCLQCEQSLPWTVYTPLIEDEKGIWIDKWYINKVAVLFWIVQPNYIQSIIKNLNHPKNNIWLYFLANKIIEQLVDTNLAFDTCFEVPTTITLLKTYQYHLTPIIHIINKKFNIPTHFSFKKSFNPKILPNFWVDKKILVIADSLNNPNIESCLTFLQEVNAKRITLFCIINRI